MALINASFPGLLRHISCYDHDKHGRLCLKHLISLFHESHATYVLVKRETYCEIYSHLLQKYVAYVRYNLCRGDADVDYMYI